MIEISLEEAMRCLQIFQEQQPENGYTFSCFNLAISALKTIEDMKNNTINFYPSTLSLEMIEKLSNFHCLGRSCKDCPCTYTDKFTPYNCASFAALNCVCNYKSFEHVDTWAKEHPDIVAQWQEEIERRTNNE